MPDHPQPRRVLYVVSRFPAFSHTFTSNEMAAVAAEGVEVFVAPIWKTLPGHAEQAHAVDRPFLSKAVRPNLRSVRTWIGALKGFARRPQTVGLVIRLIAGHLKSFYQPPKLLASIPKGFYLGQWCRENKIDHIHAHFLTTPTAVALIASAVSGVPYSYTAHAFDITSRRPRSINGAVPLKANRAALGVTISNFNRRYLLDHYPALRGARLDVIYNGIDTSLFKAPETPRPLHKNGDPWRIMSVSRLEPKKGYEYLVEAIIRLRERGVNVRLDIFGDGDQRARLQQLIDQHGQQDHIKLHGSILQEALAEEFQKADLFALASVPMPWGDADGLPTVLIEALAVGLPTVSTQVTGIPEIIQHEVTGLCVPPRDVNQLTDAIQWMIDHPAEAQAMGQRGRDLVLERFDRRKNAGHLLTLWREIHAKRANSRQKSSSMKLLYLHQHFTTREGTAGTRSYEFSRLLHQKGHEVTVICGRSMRSSLPHQKGKLVDVHHVDGLRILALNVPYGQQMSYLRRIFAFVGFMILAAGVAARQRKFDVIYATSTPLTIAVPAMIASFARRKPFVFEVRDLWPDVPIGMGILRNKYLVRVAQGLERLTYRRAKHIVALSPGMKEGIISKGFKPEKITIIPNASDNDLFEVPPQTGAEFRAQHPELGSGPLVVYTGAFGKVNNLSYLVRLADCVRPLDDQIRFLLIGMGGEVEKVRTLAKQLGLLNQTVFLMEPAPRQQMPAILSAAAVATSTVLHNPVLWANSANKFFDALAAGRPMVINHEGWQADLLRESGAGLVLDAEDVGAAAHQLVDVLHDPVWLENARKAAKQLAQERFSRDQLAVVLENVLQNAVR